MSKLAGTLGLAAIGAAAFVVERARRISEEQGRPLSEVLREMPGRLRDDLSTLGDDIREAADEGRSAAARREQEIDEEIEAIRRGGASGTQPA
ncbi:MAG TPA: hypothetical protein VHL51_09525 [Gaiellales bacterium]|nr:hypothetical protein [Gaiellales bacterium]